ncbi:MAG: DUF3019 domain-containing protein [Granulosicoccus sp.]|nr:DUF3019 domain-containing protein [Granulosicoccus sp.]
MRAFTMLLLCILFLPCVEASEMKLTVTPDKCVALRKGQTCYQTLSIKFTASEVGDYCLKIAGQSEMLKCWSSTTSTEYRYELAASEAVIFEMVDAKQSTIASEKVTVAWVYKQSRSRSRWRLF